MNDEMSNDTKDLLDTIENLRPWFHNIHITNDIQTAPDHFLGDFPSYKWEKIKKYLPENMEGLQVLDLGCNAGFYSFELARRGAEVLAIDIDQHYLRQGKWLSKVFGLQDKIEFRQMHVYDVAKLEQNFDLVFFMGLFYHLRYPMLALDIITQKVKQILVFQSLSLPNEAEAKAMLNVGIGQRELLSRPDWPAMAFIENNLQDDPTNWWVPNRAAINAMLRTCGMRQVVNPEHEIYFYEPDPERQSVAVGWNKSEYLSATGKDWHKDLLLKTAKHEEAG